MSVSQGGSIQIARTVARIGTSKRHIRKSLSQLSRSARRTLMTSTTGVGVVTSDGLATLAQEPEGCEGIVFVDESLVTVESSKTLACVACSGDGALGSCDESPV